MLSHDVITRSAASDLTILVGTRKGKKRRRWSRRNKGAQNQVCAAAGGLLVRWIGGAAGPTGPAAITTAVQHPNLLETSISS